MTVPARLGGPCALCGLPQVSRSKECPGKPGCAYAKSATPAKTETGAAPVACFAFVPGLVALARGMGYALAIHGTLARDYDFIAAPWTEDAASAEDLVEAIRVRVGGFIVGPREDDLDRDPKHLPHGRLAWSVHLGGGPYIDLSVMPRERPKDRP